MSTVLAENRTYLTPDEYLAAERQAATRSEYFNGQVYAMVSLNLKTARRIP